MPSRSSRLMYACRDRDPESRRFLETLLSSPAMKGFEGRDEGVALSCISCILAETIVAMPSKLVFPRTAATNPLSNVSSLALIIFRIEKYSSLYPSSSETVRFIAILRLISAVSSKVQSDPARLHALQGEGCPLHY